MRQPRVRESGDVGEEGAVVGEGCTHVRTVMWMRHVWWGGALMVDVRGTRWRWRGRRIELKVAVRKGLEGGHGAQRHGLLMMVMASRYELGGGRWLRMAELGITVAHGHHGAGLVWSGGAAR